MEISLEHDEPGLGLNFCSPKIIANLQCTHYVYLIRKVLDLIHEASESPKPYT
jgi:hypothetical protein